MSFSVTVTTVLVMFAYAVPGYLLMKGRVISREAIPAFAAVLLYLCAPFQIIYAMQQITYSPEMLKTLGFTMLLAFALMGGMLALVYFALRKKQRRVPYRICTAAAALGNCGFMGIPLIEALMPEYPQGVAFASAFFLPMNILMWTVVSFIISRDRRYVSVKKVFLNPSTIGMAVALALFLGRIQLTGQAMGMATLLGRMTTPVCMLILGMRLALIPIKPMFTSPLQYLAVGLKLIVFPLLALGLMALMPLERAYVRVMYILCCVPVAALVLSFAELLDEGQDVAANVVLLSTLLSVVTIPLMLMIA